MAPTYVSLGCLTGAQRLSPLRRLRPTSDVISHPIGTMQDALLSGSANPGIRGQHPHGPRGLNHKEEDVLDPQNPFSETGTSPPRRALALRVQMTPGSTIATGE